MRWHCGGFQVPQNLPADPAGVRSFEAAVVGASRHCPPQPCFGALEEEPLPRQTACVSQAVQPLCFQRSILGRREVPFQVATDGVRLAEAVNDLDRLRLGHGRLVSEEPQLWKASRFDLLRHSGREYVSMDAYRRGAHAGMLGE